ncbi:MAG TPA: hypothetical protein PKN54_05975 [Candidatus Cloacimonas acidaminovorans]|nr:hypothetical protein [Candidatus Cloacimonas sp.]HNV62484.1 hypothetical protein [Candidatus Cloacimonas acidaminovorans]
MKRNLIFLFIPAIILVAGALFATESRMAGLGFPYGYIKDNSEISIYPGAINRYKTQVIGELKSPGSNPDWTLGANLPIKKCVGGIYLNTLTGINVDEMLYDSESPNLYSRGDLDLSKKIQLYLGFWDKWGIGFGMAIDNIKNDLSDTLDIYKKSSAYYFDLSGGMSTDKCDVGLQVKYAGGSAENELTTYKDFNDEFYRFGVDLAGRYYLLQNQDFDVMCLGKGYFNIGSKKIDTPNQPNKPIEKTTDDNNFMIEVGAGVNYKLNDTNTIIFGFKPIRFASESIEVSKEGTNGSHKMSHSFIYVPEYNLAVESQITRWLTGRVGARQNYVFYSEKDEPSGDGEFEDSEYQSEFVMNLGLGFNFGKFSIDAVLEHDFLHHGPEFIGGKTNGLASMISLTYQY